MRLQDILWCSIKRLRYGPNSFRPPLTKYLQPVTVLVHSIRNIFKPPIAVVTPTASIILRTRRPIFLRVLSTDANWICILQNNISATGIRGEFIVLTIEGERDWMITVEFVDKIVCFLGGVKGIARAIWFVGCVPQEKCFGVFDAIYLLGD